MANEPAMAARKQWAFVILLVAATFLAYQPVWHAGFIWDDNSLLLDNPMIKQADGWWRVWCTKFIDYIPGVSFFWWIEWHLWHNTPPAYHLANVLWHAAGALLLWRVLERLAVPGAMLAAAIFALHPVNVETAAWVAEQKNTQALFFFLSAVWCHLQFEDSNKRLWQGLSIGAFALALASKTAVAPLPFVLLWLAWWRRGRVTRLDVLRATPFLVLVIIETAIASSTIGAQGVTFPVRLARAGDAVWFYLGKAFLPVNLVSIYPKWTINPANPLAWLPGLLFIGLLYALWRSRQSWARAVLFGLGYCVLMLLPVLGFYDITLMRYEWVADHWQYFAIIGPITLLAVACHLVIARNAMAGWMLSAVILIACAVLTWQQARIYKSGDVFWAEFVRVNKPAIDDFNAGRDFLARGKTDEAEALFRQAILLQPAYSAPYNGIAELLLRNGKFDEARPLLEEAIKLRPEFPEAHENLGRVLLAKGQTAEALDHFQRGADLRPRDDTAQYRFGKVLLQVNLPDDAVIYLQKAVDIEHSARTESPFVLGALAVAYGQTGRFSDAVAAAQSALPLASAAHNTKLADALQAQIKLYQNSIPPGRTNGKP